MHITHTQFWYMDVVLIGIILGYLVIAWQFFSRVSTSRTTEGRTALTQLILIFIFCAMAGYLPRLIELPDFLTAIIHIILVIVTWLYIIFGKVDRLAAAVDKDHYDKDFEN